MNVSLNSVIDESWTATITPHRGWFDWRLKQLWGYRDLISLFVWRDFVSISPGESNAQLLTRLDLAIAKAYNEEIFIDEINPPPTNSKRS